MRFSHHTSAGWVGCG